jgi:hypothetical protein
MTKNYYLLLVCTFLCVNFINAQVTCPELIGTQTTSTTIHFKITGGTCGDYPDPIRVFDGDYIETFELLSCHGTNLKYTTAGVSLPVDDSFIADFTAAGICGYVEGALIVLSNNDVKLNESVSIYPNPLIKQRNLNLKFATNLSAKVYMYDVTGKLAIRDEVNNAVSKKINTSALTNGIYFLQIATDKASITRKVIIMN